MAAKQLDWCQHNQEAIVKRANKLYAMMQSEKTSGFLKRRCCDFRKLEAVLQKWVESRKGWIGIPIKNCTTIYNQKWNEWNNV